MDLRQFSNTGNGFGQGAYDRALAAGYKPSQIKQALSGSGLTIGEKVGKKLTGNTDLYKHRGGGGQLGMGTYNNARASGMTNAQIRASAASSGLRIGDLAAQQLNVNPGKTYLGIAPGVQGSFKGNSGNSYRSRPTLIPRGYGMGEGKFGTADGFSPTMYIAGGTSDYENLNFTFNTDKFNAENAGGGYSDPTFNQVNAGMPGGYGGGLGSPSQTAPGQSVGVNPTNNTTAVGKGNDLKIGTNKKKGSGSTAFKRSSSTPDRTNTSLSI